MDIGFTDVSNAQLSPDGKFLFCLVSNNSYSTYQLSHLMRFDWPSLKNPVNFSKSLDRPINMYTFDGNLLWASVEDKGRDLIYQWQLTDPKPKELTGQMQAVCRNCQLNQVLWWHLMKLPLCLLKL
ncbi:MAG: hypothetical protein IPO65_08750 [Saprospiraceae bacterium]|nr:hypothetical protein [Saprospiraceae bacterium]